MKGDPVSDHIREFLLLVAWALSIERKDLWMSLLYSSWEPLQRPVKHTVMFFQSYNPTLGTNFIITVRKYQTKITFKEELTCAHSLRRYKGTMLETCGLHFAESRKRWMQALNMSSIFSFIWIINWIFRVPVHGMVPSHSGVVLQFLLIVSKNTITDIPEGVPHPIPPVLLNSSCN